MNIFDEVIAMACEMTYNDWATRTMNYGDGEVKRTQGASKGLVNAETHAMHRYSKHLDNQIKHDPYYTYKNIAIDRGNGEYQDALLRSPRKNPNMNLRPRYPDGYRNPKD